MAQQRREAPGSLAPLFKSVRPAPDDSLLGSALSEASYGFFLNTFEGQLHSAPYRSPFEHAKPTFPGPQTAVVFTPSCSLAPPS
jgi:type VI secretion system secreted protein VgrG